MSFTFGGSLPYNTANADGDELEARLNEILAHLNGNIAPDELLANRALMPIVGNVPGAISATTDYAALGYNRTSESWTIIGCYVMCETIAAGETLDWNWQIAATSGSTPSSWNDLFSADKQLVLADSGDQLSYTSGLQYTSVPVNTAVRCRITAIANTPENFHCGLLVKAYHQPS